MVRKFDAEAVRQQVPPVGAAVNVAYRPAHKQWARRDGVGRSRSYRAEVVQVTDLFIVLRIFSPMNPELSWRESFLLRDLWLGLVKLAAGREGRVA